MANDKLHMAIPTEIGDAIAEIERRTDIPKSRIVRRALEDYIKAYAAQNPDFKVSGNKPKLKPELKTDVVSTGGQRRTVIVEGDGRWRFPVASDYVGVEETEK